MSIAPKMKLKLNTAQAAAAAALPPASQASTPGTSIKLKISKPSGGAGSPPAATSPPAPSASVKKTKTSKAVASTNAKKRARDPTEDDDDAVEKTNKKQATGANFVSPQDRPTGPVIKLKTNSQPQTIQALNRLRLKAKGKLPPRPTGVGYDSDAEDAEQDPSIEENIILRMTPGPDCDYLRNAIEERKIGQPINQGGANVAFKFFSRESRRAVVRVFERRYAAILVDLPCIIESMKSWDRRGWWKSADMCQMLVVIGQVADEDAAKTFPLPKEVTEQSWQWPHGLTPPMHNVRNRRFRKRVSHRTIEAAEEEVERLLAADESAKAQGGGSHWDILDMEALRRDEMGNEDYDDEDAEGDLEDEYLMEEDEATAAETMARMEQVLGADDDDDDEVNPAGVMLTATDAAVPTPTIEAELASVREDGRESSDVKHMEDFGNDDEDEDDEEDDEDEDEEEEEEEIDEEARVQALQLTQQREEISYLEQQLAMQKEAYNKQQNPLLRQKLVGKIKSYEADLQVKRRALGIADDDA